MVDDPKQTPLPPIWPEAARGMGDPNWRVRRQAVNRLREDTAEETVQYILRVLREDHRDLARVNGAIQILARTPADVVPNLLELLHLPDADVRSYAALTLGERGDPRAIQDLIEILSDGNPNVCTHAIEALGKLKAAAAVDALLEWIDKRDFAQGFPALDALIAIGDQRVAERLEPLLSDPLFKTAAVEALGELGDDRSIQPLLARLSDHEIECTMIVRALARLDQLQQQRYGSSIIAQEVQRLATTEHISTLIGASAHVRETDVQSIAKVLSWFAGEQADEALINLVKRWPVQDSLIDVLANRTPTVIPRLVLCIGSASGELRRAILQILVRRPIAEALPVLLQAIESEEDDELIAHVMDAVARVGDPRLNSIAFGRLGHPSATVRHAAVLALSAVTDSEVLVELKTRLQDPSPLVRESAVKAAAHDDDCRELLFACTRDEDERVRRAAMEQLVAVNDQRAVACLTEALRSDGPHVRAAAAAALSKSVDEAAAAQLLIQALRDDDVWVRYFAIRSLVALNQQTSVTASLTSLATSDPAAQVRIAAVEALGRCGKTTFPLLTELAASANTELAAAAIMALPGTGHPAVLSRLAELVQDADLETCKHAIRALAVMNDQGSVGVLRDLAEGRSSRLWREAIAALATMTAGDAAWALVETAAWPQRRSECIDGLVRMSDAAVPALARGLRSLGLDIRRAIVEALGRIQSADATGVLATAVSDSAPAVRHAASAALRLRGHIDRGRSARRAFEGEI